MRSIDGIVFVRGMEELREEDSLVGLERMKCCGHARQWEETVAHWGKNDCIWGIEHRNSSRSTSIWSEVQYWSE